MRNSKLYNYRLHHLNKVQGNFKADVDFIISLILNMSNFEAIEDLSP